jgi:V8-like Glu-specific endopeptidase
MSAQLTTFAFPLALAGAAGGTTAGSTLSTVPPEPVPIVGGVPTGDEFDAVVALEVEGSGSCTGTLVDPRVVLTAAHCFATGRDDQVVNVRFGADNSGVAMVAAGYGIHPSYCSSCVEKFGSAYKERFDFAYVELPEPHFPSDGVLLPLTDQGDWDDTMEIGSSVTLVGYGVSDNEGAPTPNVLPKHKVTTVIRGFSDNGVEFFAGQDEVTRDTCGGDSGGPVIVWNRDGQMRLAGVTSRGADPCGSGGWYGVSFAALQWLDIEVGTELLPTACELADCLDTTPSENRANGCAVCSRSHDAAWLLPGLLLGLRRRR